MKNATIHYRQGDVMIERVEALPAQLTKIEREGGRVILAHGEVTGHAHAISSAGASLFASELHPDVTFLDVKEAMAELVHDEHSTIQLPAGTYRVTRQREYSPEQIRRVAD